MSTIDSSGNRHRPAGTPGAGQFDGHVRAAPTGGLTANNPRAAFTDAAPPHLTDSARAGWESANQLMARADPREQQPIAYLAHLAHQNHRLSAAKAAEMPDNDAWQARADRFDELADQLYAAAGRSRYPIRNPNNVGADGYNPNRARDLIGAHTASGMVEPVGVAATRAALRNGRGEPDGQVRIVRLTWESKPPTSSAEPFDVVGPKDGRPVVVFVDSGCPTMRITAGHAIVVVNGSGFGITVEDGAKATIIPKAKQKISLTDAAGSRVDFYPEPDTRGYQSVADGATFKMHGTAEDVTISTDSPRHTGSA